MYFCIVPATGVSPAQGLAAKHLVIATAMAELAIKLDLKCVAEGIETKQQFEIVKNLGCHYVQGFFCGRPVPGERFLDYVTDLPFRDSLQSTADVTHI